MESKNQKGSSNANRELFITRTLNAPRELVWEAFTNPGHIKNWWGPNGFTNTIFIMDVKPGGVWEFVMHGPDGKNYDNKIIYKEIVKPERIIFDHLNPNFTATITFTADGEKTLLTWRMIFETAALFEQSVKTFKADEGLVQTVERLGVYMRNVKM